MNNTFLDYKVIGKRLKTVREAQGISQQALADRCFIAPSYLSHIESGNRNVSLDTFAIICKELQVSTDYILFDSIAPCDASAQIILNKVHEQGEETYSRFLKIIRALASIADQL